MKGNRIAWMAGAAALAWLCVCGVLLAAAALAGPRLLQAWSPTMVGPAPPPTPTASPVPANTPPPGPTPVDTPVELSAEIARQMDAIQDEVVQLRGLYPTGPVERALLTPEELRQRVLDDFLADYGQEEADHDARVFWLLGLVEEDFDLWNLYLDLYSEQVAGYYDDETKKMYVVQGSRFGGPERVTYAHEYTHALQDMHFEFRGKLNYTEEACEVDPERCAAIGSLLEGDATLLEEQWLRTYASQQDLTEFLEFIDSYQSPVFDSTPRFLQQDFLFPYTEGYLFVGHLYRRGGWAEVDAAYADPPLSTEQMLHPEKYPRDAPVRLAAPDLLASLGEGWREIKRSTLGEWFVRLSLEQFLPREEARAAAAGWGGDTYLAFQHEAGGAALLVIVVWDGVGEAQEFLAAFQRYGDLRFGAGERDASGFSWSSGEWWSRIERSGNQTLWILAPDEAVGGVLREAAEFPAPRG